MLSLSAFRLVRFSFSFSLTLCPISLSLSLSHSVSVRMPRMCTYSLHGVRCLCACTLLLLPSHFLFLLLPSSGIRIPGSLWRLLIRYYSVLLYLKPNSLPHAVTCQRREKEFSVRVRVSADTSSPVLSFLFIPPPLRAATALKKGSPLVGVSFPRSLPF